MRSHQTFPSDLQCSIALISFSLFVFALVPTCAEYGMAAVSDELVAGAKKEGVINVHAPSNIGPQGAQELGAAFNKKYRLNIKLNYSPSSSFTTDTGKLI